MRRLTYLVLYAYELFGKSYAPEKDVRTILRSAKVWDPSNNANRWLKKRVRITEEGEDGIKLTAPGREDAVAALKENSRPKCSRCMEPRQELTQSPPRPAGKEAGVEMSLTAKDIISELSKT